MQGFLIAGTNSGCGKTTITIGLMALLKSLGKKVAPFKTGPDYIDPLFHSEVLGTPSYNLDTFMLPKDNVQYLFRKHCTNKDIAIVEGVMGMYDGLGEKSNGSTFELSNILGLPIILVVNCKGLYQSVAAIVKGFATLKEGANIQGVILNHISNDEQFGFLKKIIEHDCHVPCLGYVPTNKEISLESRHLGLIQAEEVGDLSDKIKKLTATLTRTININKLLKVSEIELVKCKPIALPKLNLKDLNIGIAHDKAFRFYYRDNLDLLKALGASLHFFSPLKDKTIPSACNCLYLGGGYPEVFALELSQNTELLNNIKAAVQKGMPSYAECGGLMYLCNKIIDTDGKQTRMVGVFNATIQMTKRLRRFGYANIKYNGTETRCHEFHRSEVLMDNDEPNYSQEYCLNKPEKEIAWQCGLKNKNCLAGYAHIHFYSNFQFFEQIIKLWKKAII